jgi:hypothetical protein
MTGHFRIVGDADLGEEARRKADELSLVSTQYLRKTLKAGGKPEVTKGGIAKGDKSGGFDPYDNN